MEPKCSLAGLLISTNRPVEGIGLLRSALQTKPGHLPALFMLGKTLWDVGERDEAILVFGQLAGADPANPESHRQLAKAEAAASRPRDAVASFERGVARAPSADLHSDFAWLLATHADPAVRDGRRAVELAEKAIAAGQTAARIVVIAAAWAEAGEFERAIREVETAIPGLPPESEPAMRHLIEDLRKRDPVRADPRFP